MKYRVLTVSREYGSGGIFVARQIGQALGWRVVDSEFIQTIVERANVDPSVAQRYDERVDPWIERISRKALWHGAFSSVATIGETDVFDAHTMAILTKDIILESAAMGECVIVGRGAQCALAGRDDTYHVFIHAPRSFRLQLLRQRLGERDDFEQILETVDHRRADYVRMNFERDAYDRHLYDLMVNTRGGIDLAARAILAGMGHGD
jgi:cytidylate kinase